MRFALDSTPRKNRITTTRSHTVGRAAKTVVEALEGRQMLASVEAGQFAVFQGPGGQAVRINIGGSRGSLDFIGATRDQNGQARLNDIPMTIFDAGGNVVREQLGGFGGRRGINLADEVLNNGQGDSLFVGPTAPYTNVPSGRVNLDGLASNTLGKTYGVNSYPGGFLGTQVDILRVDSKAGNVVVDSEISDEILAQLQILSPIITKADIGAVTTDQQAVIGADFAQDDPNLLYFAMNVNFPSSSGGATPTITRTVTPAMFTYNLATKQVVLDQTLFGFNNAQDRIRIDDFTFLDDGRIAMFGSVALGQGAQPRVGLFFSAPDAVFPDQFQPVRIGEQQPGQPLPPITTELAAIEAIPGEDYIIAITEADNAGGADDAQMVIIDPVTGRGRNIGPVVDPDQPNTVTNRLGENIRDLAWNPRVTDQVYQPGKRGILLGSESTYDVLLALDIRERFQNSDLYAIYGNDVSPDMSVAIAAFAPLTNNNLSFNQRLFGGLMQPFNGSAGSVLTNMTTGEPETVGLGNGGLYLGIRTADEDDAITVPVLGLSGTEDFAGSRPGVALPRTVRPGVYLNGSIKEFLFGGTITGSVSGSGTVTGSVSGSRASPGTAGVSGSPTGSSGTASAGSEPTTGSTTVAAVAAPMTSMGAPTSTATAENATLRLVAEDEPLRCEARSMSQPRKRALTALRTNSAHHNATGTSDTTDDKKCKEAPRQSVAWRPVHRHWVRAGHRRWPTTQRQCCGYRGHTNTEATGQQGDFACPRLD